MRGVVINFTVHVRIFCLKTVTTAVENRDRRKIVKSCVVFLRNQDFISAKLHCTFDFLRLFYSISIWLVYYTGFIASRDACDAVWFDFEHKSHFNCEIKMHAVWFDLVGF
jgi:Holliday junction resolvase-like predicted endonuclease